ncbi:MAG: metal ABC transporter ATP-binding protein [Lachnospiraceae bacterium]|nr:metal ABC transporter ATP-binding protein [Lachnospiraceae bacterium]
MSLIKVDRLSVGYEGVPVEKDISFSVDQGDYLCIIGENGSGKSTLIKTLLGLQPPISGNIIFNSKDESVDVPENNEGRGKHCIDGIGYLPQQTVVQRDFPASVKEVVLSGCQGRCGLRPFYNKEEKDVADANMERMGILQLKNKCYRELSGGQQQRVLLARALCATKKLLLLDEPVSGLDPKVTMEMYDLIKKLNDEGLTIIMITHDIKVATLYASHILHLGAKLFFGTTDEYLSSKAGKFFMLREKGGLCI